MRQALAMKEMEKEAAAKKRGRHFLCFSVFSPFLCGLLPRRGGSAPSGVFVAFPFFALHTPSFHLCVPLLVNARAHPSCPQKNSKTPAQKPPFAPKSKPTRRPAPRKPQGTRRSARASPSRLCPIALRRLHVRQRRRRA